MKQSKTSAEEIVREMQTMAEKIKINGVHRLKMPSMAAHRLEAGLRRIAAAESAGEESLRRLKLESGHIETCLRMARQEGRHALPAAGHSPRILMLAQRMLDRGENRLSRESIMEMIAAFDAVQPLRMEELQRMPAALNIAMCEALQMLIDEALAAADARRRALRWVGAHVDAPCPRGSGDDFWAHALQMCAEQEKPNLHARVERRISRAGWKIDMLVENVHRRAADRCLRLDHLMQCKHLLAALDWESCFEQLSTAEMELCEDPAQIYAAMDGESRNSVREAVAQMADALKLDEAGAVRHALRAAGDALRAHGAQDPRATVCWYFYDDDGRAELFRMLNVKACPPRCVPDPKGKKTTALLALGIAAICALMLWAMDHWLLAICALPLAWCAAMQILARFYPIWRKPARILKLDLQALPENARTLVALPVLLSSEARVRQMLEKLAALGCMERDENVDYLLLGDFRDADAPCLAEDEAILSAARSGIAGLNAGAERNKYYYLHRNRSFRGVDQRWMGENRKRGALMALNRLLLNGADAETAFSAECACASKLAGRYRYVLTLDADTEYLPGTLQKLVGAMLHPLNRRLLFRGNWRGYAVLQPCMQMTADACANEYVRLMDGEGGMNLYPVSNSNFYQDFIGRGCFAGKGIYEIRSFAEATESALPNDAILSHDLIEGILSGAGYLNDICFFDGCPEDLQGDLVRMHRWTRGDWQLLPLLFSRLPIAAVDRFQLLGNLLRSLYAPALTALLIHSVWLDAPSGFLLGLLLAFLQPILHPRSFGRAFRSALLRLALLPTEAACMMDAILRTLWRLGVSRKHLMDWIPAADASGGMNWRAPGRIAALLLLPGLLRSFWVPAVLALAALFALGAGWAEDLSRTPVDAREAMDANQKRFLEALARKTWLFFERYVPEDGCGLPPDNVQLDPPVGAARRTSPTNIGLYLMSCICAGELGFLEWEKVDQRLECCAAALEKLEKWNGQLYNWYDLDRLQALRPRYVSAVDSGNLAGALLLCAEMTRTPALAHRLKRLAQDMNLAALYDKKRRLFHIGMDVESGQMSQAYYDLYASEARILSFCAIMLGQAPIRHWRTLSREAARVGKHTALISWSGTMFEYLMPELILRSCPNSLAGQSRRGVLACQMDFARPLHRPWGVSESGYYAFDLQLNYQYRAFGMRGLALNGNAVQDVAAPYAAALALSESPRLAAENLRNMCELGWCGELGMYEAADYMHCDANGQPRIVRSHMAHHQGMLLCAICNALTGDRLAKRFMDISEARALRLLLQEKPISGAKRKHRRGIPRMDGEARRQNDDFSRRAHRESWAVDAHLLHGSETTALVTAEGAAYVWSRGLQLNRFFGDLLDRHQGMYVHLRDPQTGETAIMGGAGSVQFDAGFACFQQMFAGLRIEMRMIVSPEDGAFYQQISISNSGSKARELDVCGCLAVALAAEKDMRAHPMFQNLFVQSECVDGSALLFRRKMREAGADLPALIYVVSADGAVEFETSMEKLLGRTGSLGCANGITDAFTGSAGHVLNPCAALRVRLRLNPESETRMHFVLRLADPETLRTELARLRAANAPERAMELSFNQIRAMLLHAGIDGQHARLLHRASVLLLDPILRPNAMENRAPQVCTSRGDLWRTGVSGDLPILLAEIEDAADLDCVREAIRAHGFYRMLGLQTDLVVINHRGSDYHQPARGALADLIASSHLNGQFNLPGGAYVLEKQNMDAASIAAIECASALRFVPGSDVCLQLRSQMDGLKRRRGEAAQPMPGRAMAIPDRLQFFNGYGGFDQGTYVLLLRNGILPPAPWCNALASEHAGAIVSERGGGFAWFENSRSKRITPFANDSLREGWGWMFYLIDDGDGRWIRLLPGDVPMTDFCVRHAPGASQWKAAAGDISFEVEMHAEADGLRFDVVLENEGSAARHLRLAGLVNWCMGADIGDGALLRTWSRFGACFAMGTVPGVGCFAADDPQARNGCDRQSLLADGDMMQPRGLDLLEYSSSGWTLHLPISLRPREMRRCRFLLGYARDIPAAYALARNFRSGEALRRSSENWQDRLAALRIETPDEALNQIANGFLQAQVLNARIRGRAGLYQPGGAFGFRDQLQDMLPMIHYEPWRVRRHLLDCAARQFEAGDVLHWWHEPYEGVRTKISDDMLFLPFVAAQYVRITGDQSVLREEAPFLQEIAIPEDREDIYAPMQPSDNKASLHAHCMRAFHRAACTGVHGLCRMGAGDWNDGMNRVGAQGLGESVWLTQFLAVCAADYARIAPDPEDCAWLSELNARLCAAVEAHGWDGQWYLRAYADTGEKLGSRESEACKIDLISQTWAVLAGLDADRSRSAMDAAWEHLVDADLGTIALLAPPFDGAGFDPGYIAAYPPGVRENGAQYTHGACWMLMALARMGDEARAHRVLSMLIPVNHAQNQQDADRYRVEPYVMAADIYTDAAHAGRGGWTWYTGSAAWMLMAIMELLGFERCGSRVRMKSLLGDWPEAAILLRFGSSRYHLICRAGADSIELDGRSIPGEWIEMIDDGRDHSAIFPPRKA